MVNSLLILSNISGNNCSFLFFLWFSADSVCHHTISLCHPRNFIYTRWKTKIIFPASTFWYSIVKPSTPPQPTTTAPAEPELILSLHCFRSPCGTDPQPGSWKLELLSASQPAATEQGNEGSALTEPRREASSSHTVPWLSTELVSCEASMACLTVKESDRGQQSGVRSGKRW